MFCQKATKHFTLKWYFDGKSTTYKVYKWPKYFTFSFASYIIYQLCSFCSFLSLRMVWTKQKLKMINQLGLLPTLLCGNAQTQHLETGRGSKRSQKDLKGPHIYRMIDFVWQSYPPFPLFLFSTKERLSPSFFAVCWNFFECCHKVERKILKLPESTQISSGLFWNYFWSTSFEFSFEEHENLLRCV